MSSFRKVFWIAVASYVATLTFAMSTNAGAQTCFRRIHAAGACTATAGTNVNLLFGKLTNYALGESATLVCAFDSDSEISHNGVSVLTVHGQRGTSASFTMTACVAGHFGLGAACGSSSTPPVGNFTQNLSTAAWLNPSYATWYPYVQATFNGSSGLVGFYIQN